MNLNDPAELDAINDILVDEDDHVLLAEVHIGEDAAEFIKSDLGKYIVGRANQDIKQATNELKRCFWWRTNRIRFLQNQIKVAENTKAWLIECINSGQIALQTLESRQVEQ